MKRLIKFKLNLMNLKKIGLFLGPLLFVLFRLFFKSEGLSDEANAVLASTVWIAVWWITEAIPISVTSLLPIILFPLSGALSLTETSSSFGHRYIFLYMGGFILALAIEKWNLHKRIALNIIKLIGTDVKKIILGFMLHLVDITNLKMSYPSINKEKDRYNSLLTNLFLMH